MKRLSQGLLLMGVCAFCVASALAQTPAPPAPPVPTTPPVDAEWAQQPPAPPAVARTPMPAQKPGAPIPPPGLGKWWKDSEIVNELKLTPDQIN